MAKKALFLLLVPLLMSLVSCNVMRHLATQKKDPELPPATVSNVPMVAADEPPLPKTEAGFVSQNIPGVTPKPPVPLKYITYVGASN
jgi:hypothetical protein